MLSLEAKDASLQIVRRLRLGARLSEIVERKDEALALFDLFKDEHYLLVEDRGRFHVSNERLLGERERESMRD